MRSQSWASRQLFIHICIHHAIYPKIFSCTSPNNNWKFFFIETLLKQILKKVCTWCIYAEKKDINFCCCCCYVVTAFLCHFASFTACFPSSSSSSPVLFFAKFNFHFRSLCFFTIFRTSRIEKKTPLATTTMMTWVHMKNYVRSRNYQFS